jgi:uncharacterized membrane protein
MTEWQTYFTQYAVVIINALTLLIIAIGMIELLFRCLRAVFGGASTGEELREGYLRYARWLILGLTLQLGGDIIETAIAPTWDDIGRLGAIAVIRTFLNYFLERDIMEARQLRSEREGEAIQQRTSGS